MNIFQIIGSPGYRGYGRRAAMRAAEDVLHASYRPAKFGPLTRKAFEADRQAVIRQGKKASRALTRRGVMRVGMGAAIVAPMGVGAYRANRQSTTNFRGPSPKGLPTGSIYNYF